MVASGCGEVAFWCLKTAFPRKWHIVKSMSYTKSLKLITRRSKVRILPPLPWKTQGLKRNLKPFLFPYLKAPPIPPIEMASTGNLLLCSDAFTNRPQEKAATLVEVALRSLCNPGNRKEVVGTVDQTAFIPGGLAFRRCLQARRSYPKCLQVGMGRLLEACLHRALFPSQPGRLPSRKPSKTSHPRNV